MGSTKKEVNAIEVNTDNKIGEDEGLKFLSLFTSIGKEKLTHKQTFKTSRELMKQQTRPKPIQGTLFDLLSEKERSKAVLIEESGGLLSQITDGINGGVLGSKVIVGLAQTLAEQSELFNTEEEMLGISEDINNRGIKLVRQRYGDATLPFPSIYIEERKFTKLVKGIKDTSSSDRSEVRDMLYKLANSTNFIKIGSKYVGLKLLSIEATIVDEKTKARGYIVMLRPIFVQAIKTDFVTMRKDTLAKLGGRTSDLCMKLFFWLTEQHSYKTIPSYPVIRISKDVLLNKIAILKSYENRKDRIKTDLDKALSKMKELHLITEYREEIGADGYSLNSIFTLNKEYTKEPNSIDLSKEEIGTIPPPNEDAMEMF